MRAQGVRPVRGTAVKAGRYSPTTATRYGGGAGMVAGPHDDGITHGPAFLLENGGLILLESGNYLLLEA